jgi:uncharacterized protein YdeI (YjbR/CyaY-like superfamily)
MPESKPSFFESGAHFRRWLAANHQEADEVWVGFWKAHTGRGGLTYEEAVEEALCFGWIDGLVKRVDELAYKQRFTPRRPRSIWSAVNIRKVEALRKAGRLARAGLAAFEGRDPSRANLYSGENRQVVLCLAYEKRFRARNAAWRFFETQPAGYRRTAMFWVMSAKREQTRDRRLARLIEDSAKGLRVASIAGDVARKKERAA